MRIRKAIQHYLLVGILATGFIIEAVSGFILWFALPHAGGRWASLTFWSITRTTWVDIHDWVAVALTVIVIIHLAMHWKWVVTVTKQVMRSMKREEQIAMGGLKARVD
jgi:hypothetical protein